MIKILLTLLLLTLTGLNSVYAEYTKTLVTGTTLESPTTNWAAGDDASTQANLGFTFPFGSVSSPNNTTSIFINSNGGLSFTTWNAYQNASLPSSPTTIIAPYWDDLNRTTGGTIRYGTFGTSGNQRFVVAWDQVPLYGTSTLCTFQVVLHETGEIRFRYSNSSQCNGSSATVGIQETNSSYNQHTFNQAIDLTQDIVFTPTAVPPPPPPAATPLAVNVCDDFEKSLSNWTVTGTAEIGSNTSNSTSHSLNINGGNVTVTSIPINTTTSLADVTVWVRRGSDTFSEDPDNGEDLYIEYYSSANTWVTLEQFAGSGTNGQAYNRTYTMPANAMHTNFRLRMRMVNGNGGVYDYWHVDDVCLTPSVAFPNIRVSKGSQVLSDGVNTTFPKRIPGAIIEYNIDSINLGTGVADNNSIALTDSIPANTALYVNDISGSGTGPIRFVDGAPPSGLSYNFSSLSSTTDNLSFSNNNGASYNYTPTANTDGVDPNVTNIRASTTGQFQASSGSGDPSFSLRFRVIVQ